MVFGQHAVQRVAQLVGQRRNIAHLARVVHQHIRRQIGAHSGAEGAASLAFAHLAVDMAVVEDPLDLPGHRRVKTPEGIQHQRSCVRKIKRAVGGRQRRVDVGAAQFFQPEPLGFEPEIALKDLRIAPCYVEQRSHRSVRHIVGDVAHRQRRRIAAQLHLLVVPVPHTVVVDLGQNFGFGTVDPIELPIGGRTQRWIRRPHIPHQRIPGQRLLDPVDGELELEPAGQHRVDRHQPVDPVCILEVDDLLGFFVEHEGAGAAQILQKKGIVRVRGRVWQQAGRGRIVEPLPPQLKKKQAVLDSGQRLLHPV